MGVSASEIKKTFAGKTSNDTKVIPNYWTNLYIRNSASSSGVATVRFFHDEERTDYYDYELEAGEVINDTTGSSFAGGVDIISSGATITVGWRYQL